MNFKNIYKDCYPHNKTRLRYHIILVTKYRKGVLKNIKQELQSALNECEQRSHLKILFTSIGDDHLHLLVQFPPNYSLAQTVTRIKQFTTNYLYQNHGLELKRFYWKKKRLLWSDSFFASTIGAVSEQNVEHYLKMHA